MPDLDVDSYSEAQLKVWDKDTLPPIPTCLQAIQSSPDKNKQPRSNSYQGSNAVKTCGQLPKQHTENVSYNKKSIAADKISPIVSFVVSKIIPQVLVEDIPASELRALSRTTPHGSYYFNPRLNYIVIKNLKSTPNPPSINNSIVQ